MRAGIAIVSFVLLTSLAACGGRPPVPDDKLFESMFGGADIPLHIPSRAILPVVDVPGQLPPAYASSEEPDFATCEFASLLAAGRIKLNAGDGGGVQLEAGKIPYSGDVLTINLGSRHFVSATNKKSWKVNSTEFFSETVQYNISPTGQKDDSLSGDGAPLGPFEVRVVYMNDPAVGSWKLESSDPTIANFEDRRAALQQKFGGNCDKSIIAKSIEGAQRQSVDNIATNLSAGGVVEKGRDPLTIVSKKQNIVIYLGTNLDPNLNASQKDITQIAQSACAKTKIGNYSGWRLATFGDLLPLTTTDPYNPHLLRFIDAPDGRIWADLGSPPDGKVELLLVSDPLPAGMEWFARQGLEFFNNRSLLKDSPNEITATIPKALCVANLQ